MRAGEGGSDSPASAISAAAVLARRHRFRWWEVLPWAAALLWFWLLPDLLALGTQVLVFTLFALSLDLLLGYAGLVTLGHAAFFGLGAYAAGIAAARGWAEPISALLGAALLAATAGAAVGAVILRVTGLAFLMVTLALALLLQEAANRMAWLTGGADGLSGIELAPVLGLFRFDFLGRTGYLYALAVLALAFLGVRTVVQSAYGRSVVGIRENAARMESLGVPVRARLVAAYGLSAGLAGLAGAVSAQTTQVVALNALSFELSGGVLIMLMLGGAGRLYGAFIGAAAYMLVQDALSQVDVAYWEFWLGAMLVAVVLTGRGGLLGLAERAWNGIARRRRHGPAA